MTQNKMEFKKDQIVNAIPGTSESIEICRELSKEYAPEELVEIQRFHIDNLMKYVNHFFIDKLAKYVRVITPVKSRRKDKK